MASHKPPGRDVLAHVRLHHISKADAVLGCDPDEAWLVEGDRALHINLDGFPILLKSPSEQGIVRKARPDAAKPVQVRGNGRCAMRTEERGGLHDRIAALQSERHGDHVVRHQVSGPQSEVEPGRDDVDEPPLRDQVDMHLGMALQEREDKRLHHLPGRGGERIDAQCPGRNLLERLGRQHGVVNVGHRRTDPFDEGLPRLCQRDASGCSVEEADAKAPLQLCDGIAESRRG